MTRLFEGAMLDSIVSLASELVTTPSQAGIDPPDAVADVMARFLEERGLAVEWLLDDEGALSGLFATTGGSERPLYCVNACLDTAPIGDPSTWNVDPFGALVEDGWLFGRGAADSKVGAAIFAHVLLELYAKGAMRSGVAALFDLDEHSGKFGGVKAMVRDVPGLEGVYIGYPGNYGVVAGARGFFRAKVTLRGAMEHTGSRNAEPRNAITKAAVLVRQLADEPLPIESDPAFDFGPKITVTSIGGGSGFAVVPDSCDVSVDIRLTPTNDASWARATLRKATADIDSQYWNGALKSDVIELETWPPYRLADDSLILAALKNAGSRELDRDLPAVVCGPSNIGNYLSSLGIEATCGFGVTYRNLHAPNEAIEIATIAPIARAYLRALRHLSA